MIMDSWYSWNIAEGGVKHQQSNQSNIFLFHADAANRKQTVNIATRGTMW
jgi:hypothetical protein